jgi:O-antigen ligase
LEQPSANSVSIRSYNKIDLLIKAVPILLGTFIFFNVIPHTTAIKEISFYLCLAIVIPLILFKKIDFSFKSPLNIPFSLFVIWAFIGLFFAYNKYNSIHDFYAHLLKYLAVYYMLINFFNTRKGLQILSWIIIASVTIFSIGGIVHFYYLQDYDLLTQRMDFLGMEINIIGFATLFAIVLILHHFTREKRPYLTYILTISLFITTIVTLITQCRGTLLGLILALFVLFFKNKKVVIVFSLFLISLTLFMPVMNRLTQTLNARQSNSHVNERILIWNTYFEMIKDHPITGIGFGMEMWKDQKLWDQYASRVPPEWRITMNDPHNIFVSTAVRLGVIGLILFLYILLKFAKMCWRTIKFGRDDDIKSWGLCITAVFAAYLMKGMFEPALSQVPATIYYTILAMMTILSFLNTEISPPNTALKENNHDKIDHIEIIPHTQ